MLPASEEVKQFPSRHIKRPMNCFMVWSKEKRCQILKHNPGINNAEVSKALGIAWRRLSAQEKRPYVERAKKLSEEHMLENPNYKYKPKRRKAEMFFADKTKKIRSENTGNEEKPMNESKNRMFGHSSYISFPQSFHQRNNNYSGSQQQIPVESSNLNIFQSPLQTLSLSEATKTAAPHNFDQSILARRRHEMMSERERFDHGCSPSNEVKLLTGASIPMQHISFLNTVTPAAPFPCPCHLFYPIRHVPPTFPAHWYRSPASSTNIESNSERYFSRPICPYESIERARIAPTFYPEPHSCNDTDLLYRQSWENNMK